MIKRFFLRLYYKLIRMHPGKMPMVSYWRTKEYVEAKLTTKDGATLMVMDGEKHPMWGFPRGHLLIPKSSAFKGEAITFEERVDKYGPFSVLKHEVKQVFNEVWRKREEKIADEVIVSEAKEQLFRALEVTDQMKYDFMPAETMCPAVREIHRAWTKACPSPQSLRVRDFLCLLLQEDDGYRYRVQWMAIWFPFIKWNPIKLLDKGLKMVETAEVIGDMKKKIKLLRAGLSVALKDPQISKNFLAFFKEVDWKKVQIKEMDRYHLRGKYFKADLDILEY